MKTIIEWLEELPEPYRSQAIENCKNYYNEDFDGLEFESLIEALGAAFVWQESPQRHTYWEKLHDTL